MQLKKIKLAGFKSFVDPTTVPILSNLVAIVGPNGCGKSNIIDAVCWVMGESSARYLRGESSSDVIFSGSTARKPVGQASVELVFDNQDGSLGGEYASYAEISIRRVINRDSESSYFLNGTRCRRRDIIDIFLGTGLGPRSYSIIGQNMISRIIDAKPDEMRVYLEEAAGVSKYKERRRETENRIQHTKDNMARLDDVRGELEKQLASLQRQANAAEKFKTLKQEERISRVQWLAAQWRALDLDRVEYSLQIQQQETGLEARQAELTHLILQTERKRDDQRLANEAFQLVQQRFYATGNEITRTEQEIQHVKQRQQQWEADFAQVENDWTELNNTLTEVELEFTELTAEAERLVPAQRVAMQEADAAVKAYNQSEEKLQNWQAHWDTFNHQTAKATQSAEVEQTRIVHLEQRLATLKQRTLQLQQEQAQIDFSHLNQETEQLSASTHTLQQQLTLQEQQLAQVRQQITAAQTLQQQTTQQYDQTHASLQQLRGQQTSLEALQQTALGQRNNPVAAWLAKHNLDKQPRLAQSIEVAAGWERAVEKVLGVHLQAICVETLQSLGEITQDFKAGNLAVFATTAARAEGGKQAALLLEKIQSPWALDSLLGGIYVAETYAEALEICQTLGPQQSVITRDGVWLGAAWLRLAQEANPTAGVFQREQELKKLAQQITDLTHTEQQLAASRVAVREQLKELEIQRDEWQKAFHQAQAEMAKMQAQYKLQNERLTHLKSRAEKIQADLIEQTQQTENTEHELKQARAVWQQALTTLEELTAQRENLTQQRDLLRTQLQAERQQLNEKKELRHQLDIRLQTTQSQRDALQQNIQRMQAQLTTLAERKATLELDFDNGARVAELEQTLSLALNQRLNIEAELNSSRDIMETLVQETRELETQRQVLEHEIVKNRDVLEGLRLEGQSLKVKTETILEQITETEFKLEDVLQELNAEISVEMYREQVEQISQRISRLGAINLVAIEEYAACAERKDYLDKQSADLQEGLTTLEDAIARIDKETRTRFQETFDKVNARFQELFPKIFGGGHAQLELTGENILDSGMAIIACPPGKRNSTIHLLSGGEKAMTAIALVFSIFHLNPAPFCLLDEVDAPLDDANIGRFCALVKTMAEKTQFIFISHNKLAIEMGQHLMGITMHEPGVSRLVSVDIEEAVSLAGA